MNISTIRYNYRISTFSSAIIETMLSDCFSKRYSRWIFLSPFWENQLPVLLNQLIYQENIISMEKLYIDD